MNTPTQGEHIFLLPHQDDETPVLLEIERLARAGKQLCIVYLTTGRPDGRPCTVRNQESLRALTSLGVSPEAVWFLGAKLEIPDGQLQKHLLPAYAALNERFGEAPPASLHMPAWEGGHQDHDAAQLLGVALARRWDRLRESRQFPYYHGRNLKGILFKVLDPLSENGSTILDVIPIQARWRYLWLLLIYKSQWKTWIGLGPFFVWHYLLRGTQVRQPVSVTRLKNRPHAGPMLYERRAFSNYADFLEDTGAFRQLHLD